MTEKADVQWVTNLCITHYATVLNWTRGSASPRIIKSTNRMDRLLKEHKGSL